MFDARPSSGVLAPFLRTAILAALLPVFGPAEATAAPTTAQRKTIHQSEAALRQVRELIERREFSEAVKLLTAVQQKVDELADQAGTDDAAFRRLLAPLKRRLSEIQGELELEGIALPKAQPPSSRASDPAPAKPDVSFTRHIAPILVRNCVDCHGGNKPKGQLNMESYADLKRGADGSPVVQPGSSGKSRIVEVVVEGEMPKNDSKLTRAEVALLTDWIDQGAKFDGQNQSTPVRQIAQAAAANNVPKPDGPVAFSTHIAPVLAQHCTKCHGGQRPRNRLNLTTFRGLSRGGMSGPAVVAGNPGGSLLIQKLKGTAPDGNRMPLEAPPLAANIIADFEKWIAAGAKFDGPNPAAPVTEVAALATAKTATHDQLGQQRAALADKNWKLALADVEPQAVVTENFLVYGGLPREKLQEVADLAEELQSQIRQKLRLPPKEPLVKGRMTLFVFGHRVDYSEFALMVEKRTLARGSQGHWQFSIVDAYGCVVSAGKDPNQLSALVAQQITGVAIASRVTSAPRWFSEGLARNIAAQIAPEDLRAAEWDERTAELIDRLESPEALLSGQLAPSESDVLSYGFVKGLMSNQRRFNTALEALWKPAALEDALRQAYGAGPAELVATWIQSQKRRGRTDRRKN